MKKKYIIAMIISIVATIVVSYLSIVNKPRPKEFTEPKDAISILKTALPELSSTEAYEDLNLPLKDEENIYSYAGNFSDVSTVIVDLSHEVPTPTFFTLYYKDVGSENYDFLNSVDAVSMANSNQLFFNVPEGDYEEFGISINENDYQIQDIKISSETPVAQIRGIDVNYFQLGIIFLVISMQCLLIARNIEHIKNKVLEKKDKIQESKNIIKKVIFRDFLVMVGTLMATYIACTILKISFSSYMIFAAALLGICICAIIHLILRKRKNFESTFLVLTLCIGIGYAVILPKATIVSLDDQVHYMNAMELSYLGEAPYTGADLKLINTQVTIQEGYQNDIRNINSLNELYEEGALYSVEHYAPSFIKVSYLPSAAGIFIARLLGLSFTSIFVAGRIGNVVAYAFVLYLAMKILEKGKLFLLCFSTVPLILFTASNYSYDGWCLSFLALGMALFLREYRHTEYKLTRRNMLTMLIITGIGCLPKPVYFPIYLMFLFLPKEKFENDKDKRKYYMAVVVAAIIVMLTFMAPFLFEMGTGTGTDGDHRGGEGISSSGQVKFILSNFIGYLDILFRFLKNVYFNPRLAYVYTIPYQAYMPSSQYGLVFATLLLVSFLFDGTSEKLRHVDWKLFLGSIVSFIASIMLVATALYVAFTPVGADSVAGCQWRYMLPVLLPFLLVLQPPITWNSNIKSISTIVTIILVLVCSFATIIAII